MITQTELVAQISNPIGKAKVLELTRILREQQFALRDLTDLTFHVDKNIAFRAAWLLETIFLQNPEFYEENLEYLLSRVSDIKYPGCQRHYAKILMYITSPKAPKNIQQKALDYNMEPIVEQCFDWMIDPKVKIAVKVSASETLFNLRYCYPWITEELINQIKFLMRDGTAAIQSRGRKLLALLALASPKSSPTACRLSFSGGARRGLELHFQLLKTLSFVYGPGTQVTVYRVDR